MKCLSVFALAGVAALVAACGEQTETPLAPTISMAVKQPGVVRVTTNADAGPGSFRQAVLDASTDPTINLIQFRGGLGTIALQDPVTYTGAQALTIQGHSAELDGAALGADEAALVANGGGDLSLKNLTVENASGNGITVAVPASATGAFVVTLDDVTIKNNAGHGVLINDQAEYFVDPNSTSSAGSDASVSVRVTGSLFEGNGFSTLDRDGLRINEGGNGSLDAVIKNSRFVGNGADGVELDERAAGDAAFTLQGTELTANGFFSSEDYDDGIDVDESGEGSVIGGFTNVTANDNAEQGIDLNENDAGDLRVTMRNVEGSRNAAEGIEFEEDDDFAGGGDIIADLRNVEANGNGANDGDAGLKLREKGVGNMIATIVKAVASNNAIGGILVREDAAGDLVTQIDNAETLGNGDDGIKLDENSDGALDARLQRPTSSNNAGAGVALEQATTGTGVVRIQRLTATGNTDGPVTVSGSVTVIQ